MGILDRIEKLQKKPREIRERILALSVASIMILIVAVWIQTVRYNFSKGAAEPGENPVKVLWNAVSDGFENAFKGINI